MYRRYFPMVLRAVKENHGTHEDAEDLFQESLIILLEKSRSPSFVLECQLKTFLYSVCRNLWLKRVQSSRGQIRWAAETGKGIPVTEELEELYNKEKQFERMFSALTHLGEPCQTILEDYYLHKLSMTDIAEKFGYTNPENAKNQKYKCLMRLKRLFFSQYNQA